MTLLQQQKTKQGGFEMKSGKAVFLSAALVVLGGAGLIFCNGVLASNVLRTDNQTEPAIVMPVGTPVDAKQLSNVGMYSSNAGEPYMALTGVGSDIQAKEMQPTSVEETPSSQHENPTDGNLSEEEAMQMGINAIAQKYGLTPKDIGAFDVMVRGAYASEGSSTVADKLIWKISLKPLSLEDNPMNMHYGAIIDDKLDDSIHVYATSISREGTPLENEISSDKAIEIGIAALAQKYALTQETLDRFTVTAQYYEMTPETPGRHAWWVNLYPTNTDEFSEIGCYWTYIDAETGKALQLNSAADGKG